MAQALFLDVDGTLVDTYCAEEIAISATISSVPALKNINPGKFITEWRKQRSKNTSTNITNDAEIETLRKVRFANTCRKFEITFSEPEANELTTQMHRDIIKACRAFPDQNQLSNLFGKISLGIITNGYANTQRAKLVAAGYDCSAFNPFVASFDVGVAKPDARIFQIACNAIGARPDSCIHIGDSVREDLQGAISAGLKGYLIDRSNKHYWLESELVLSSIGDVAAKCL